LESAKRQAGYFNGHFEIERKTIGTWVERRYTSQDFVIGNLVLAILAIPLK
jgi:hypothetical protein